jgi:hypothetical protein
VGVILLWVCVFPRRGTKSNPCRPGGCLVDLGCSCCCWLALALPARGARSRRRNEPPLSPPLPPDNGRITATSTQVGDPLLLLAMAALAMSETPIDTVHVTAEISGVATELCILIFSDRYFVILSQLNKLGTMISAEQERGPDGVRVYAVRTLLVRRPISAGWAAWLGPLTSCACLKSRPSLQTEPLLRVLPSGPAGRRDARGVRPEFDRGHRSQHGGWRQGSIAGHRAGQPRGRRRSAATARVPFAVAVCSAAQTVVVVGTT